MGRSIPDWKRKWWGCLADMAAVRKGARATSKEASWENFIKFYDNAYSLALKKAGQRKQ